MNLDRLTSPRLLGLVSIALAVAVAVAITLTAGEFWWAASRLAWGAVVVAAIGLISGSDRALGASTLPAMAAMVVAVGGEDGVRWALALAVGCGWYLSMEAGWASIEWRAGLTITPAVALQRVQSVMTVVLGALAVGVVALPLTALAPDRTLLVRGSLIAAVLAVLLVVVRQLGPSARGS